jgi:hypothetical protein
MFRDDEYEMAGAIELLVRWLVAPACKDCNDTGRVVRSQSAGPGRYGYRQWTEQCLCVLRRKLQKMTPEELFGDSNDRNGKETAG